MGIEHTRKMCVYTLLDAGAKLKHVVDVLYIPQWVRDFVSNRKKRRKESLAVLTLLKRKSIILAENGKDVLQIIARCVWGKRGHALE